MFDPEWEKQATKRHLANIYKQHKTFVVKYLSTYMTKLFSAIFEIGLVPSLWLKSWKAISPWARGGRRYHLRKPYFNGTMLFRNMNCNYFCLLDISNSQLKPANLHKQNGRRPKRVLPYIDYSPYHSCTPPPPPRNVWDIFYFVPGTCLDITITKFGWTTCGTPFSKWPLSKLVELHFCL